MTLPLIASVLLTSITLGTDTTSARSQRDLLIATPTPHPVRRVDSPHRIESGRLWVPRTPVGSRTPLAEQAYPFPGPGSYGAPFETWNDLVAVRVDHMIVGVSPWKRYDRNGFERYREASNTWLREQGYIQKVRTHVNPAVLQQPRHASADVEPSAIIHIRERYRVPSGELEVNAAPTRTRLIRVVSTDDSSTQTASAEASGASVD